MILVKMNKGKNNTDKLLERKVPIKCKCKLYIEI